MCICVNCHHVHTCITYELIKNQHGRSSNNASIFIPTNTIIQINIKRSANRIDLDWDLQECLSFVERPGFWLDLGFH